jgi:hypothetical protein
MMKLTQGSPPRAGGEKRSDTIHLYCVVGTGTELDCRPFRLNGHQVFAVSHGDLTALVSSAPPLAYKSMKREEIIPHLAAHQAVIEQVMKDHTVVPVKFGTTARGEAEVQRILEKGYSQLKAVLEAMEAKIELDVVAQWREMSAIFAEIGEDAEIKRLKDSIFSRPSGEATWEERIQIGQLVKLRLDRMRDERAAEIVEALKPLAQDLCLHALPDDRMCELARA